MTGDETDAAGRGQGARIHIVRFAPAKVNLTLAVTGRRDDGYHSLHSVMVPLQLGDALTVSLAPRSAASDFLTVSGLAVSAAGDNLVLRAIAATRAALAARQPGSGSVPPLAVRLVKRIPGAAGLGGGSSDAAAAIEAALAAWQQALDASDKAAVAASLGSDVPFFLAQSNALIAGRGEFVEPLPAIAGDSPALLLVTPGVPVSTPLVFGAFADGARAADPGRAREVSERLATAFRAGLTVTGLMSRAQDLAAANDLLPAALAMTPELEEFTRRLEKLVGRPVCQSGSGPTQWVLYSTLAEARKAVRMVRLGIARGNLPALGEGETFVAATEIAGPASAPTRDRVRWEDRPDGDAVHRGRAIRPHSVHNTANAYADPTSGLGDKLGQPQGDEAR